MPAKKDDFFSIIETPIFQAGITTKPAQHSQQQPQHHNQHHQQQQQQQYHQPTAPPPAAMNAMNNNHNGVNVRNNFTSSLNNGAVRDRVNNVHNREQQHFDFIPTTVNTR